MTSSGVIAMGVLLFSIQSAQGQTPEAISEERLPVNARSPVSRIDSEMRVRS